MEAAAGSQEVLEEVLPMEVPIEVPTEVPIELNDELPRNISTDLPRRCAFISQFNNKYLNLMLENTPGHLKFSGEQVASPYASFQVERETNPRGSLVHLRCIHNNKYWRRERADGLWVTALGTERNENRSDWSCTLFEPEYVNGIDPTQGVRFRHAQTMNYACLWLTDQPFTDNLFLAPNFTTPLVDVVTVIDLDNLVILPRYITFKGDNGLYLDAVPTQGHEYLRYSSNDPRAAGVRNEVFVTNNGAVLIKNLHYGRFWRRSPNWIWADTALNINHSSPIDNTKIQNDLLFEPIHLGDNKIALRNLGNRRFCRRLTADRKTDCLNAAVDTIINEATIEVSETIISRQIFNVDYRLQDSRIYGETPIVMSSSQAENNTLEPSTVTVRFSATDSASNTWSNSVSLALGITTTFQAGIPLIGRGEIEISTTFTGTYEWGSQRTTAHEVEGSFTVTVPPRSRMTVRMMATKGQCDVPFSYTQRDTLVDGTIVTYRMHDGIYQGINSYNVHYEAGETVRMV